MMKEKVTTLNPFGNYSECLHLNSNKSFDLAYSKTCLPDHDYVLSLYIKKNSETGSVTFNDTVRELTTKLWERVVFKYRAKQEDLVIEFSSGDYYITMIKLEHNNTLTDWSPSPDDAEKSVNKKNSVFYQNDPPIGTLKKNDTWFKTNEDNAMYQWSGSEWVPHKFGTTSIAEGAITADLISADSVFANKIFANAANIAGWNINSGGFVSDYVEKIESGVTYYYKTFFMNGTNANGDVLVVNKYDSSKLYNSSVSWLRADGAFHSSNASISGTINATSGKIGKLSINSSGGLENVDTTGKGLIFDPGIGVKGFKTNPNSISDGFSLSADGSLFNKISIYGKGSTWITSRDDSCINVSNPVSNWLVPLLTCTGTSGSWSIGQYNYDNSFNIYYGSNANYNSSTNSCTIFKFNTSGMVIQNSKAYCVYNTSGTAISALSISTSNLGYLFGTWDSYIGSIYLCGTNVYKRASGSSTSLSDVRMKNSFKEIDNYKDFVMGIEPCMYKFNDGTSGRYHCGFKAQQVEEVMDKTVGNYGAVVKYRSEENTEVDLNDDNTYTIGLRYDELIAPHVRLTQEHELEIQELKKQIEELKGLLKMEN